MQTPEQDPGLVLSPAIGEPPTATARLHPITLSADCVLRAGQIAQFRVAIGALGGALFRTPPPAITPTHASFCFRQPLFK